MNLNNDGIISVYSDARVEYTKQLSVFLIPAYFQFFINLLEKAKVTCQNEPKKTLWQFQTYLNEIHEWNMEKVKNEINTIYNNCGCDYLDDLLKAVFIAHTKVLVAIKLTSSNKNINVFVPKIEHFLFKVLCECSKLLWSSTYLFRDGISGIEKQQNYRNIEHLLNEGVTQAIRCLTPVKSILKDYIYGDNDDNDNNDNNINEVNEDATETDNNDNNLNEVNEDAITADNNDSKEIHEDNKYTENTQEIDSNIKEPVVDIPIIEETNNKDIQNNQEPPIINIDEKNNVQFADFDAVFDSDNPMSSDMVFDPKDEDDDIPALEILEENGTNLNEGIDFDDLDELEEKEMNNVLQDDDYEVLV